MWDEQTQTLDAGRVQKVKITRDNEPVRYCEIVQAWGG